MLKLVAQTRVILSSIGLEIANVNDTMALLEMIHSVKGPMKMGTGTGTGLN